MLKTIIIILVILVVISIILYIIDKIDDNTGGSDPDKGWSDTAQRRSAASAAASEMSSNNVKRVDKEAVEIRRILSEKRVEIDTSVLNEAVQTSEKLISHAERVRHDIESNRNRPSALKNLYRVGVGISDENYALRKKIMGIQHNMDELSRRNPALRPLAHQIRCLEQSIYQNELELNNRNRILRTYIRDNFSQRERNWALGIERRKAG